MKLTEKPDFVNWTEKHYVYLEKEGPFQDTAPAAWRVTPEDQLVTEILIPVNK